MNKLFTSKLPVYTRLQMAALSEKLGMTLTQVVIMAIALMAERYGVKVE